MALSIVTFAGNAQSDSLSSVNIANDASMAANDARLVVFSISNNTITTPSGWNLISNDVIASTRRIYWFWRQHPGAGETTHTFTFSAASNFSAVQLAARGADLSNPVDVVTSVSSASTGSTLTAPDITTVTDDAILLTSYHLIANTSSLTLSLPSGMTNIATGTGTGTTGHAYRVAYEARPTAGATGTRSSTANTGAVAWGASALAIRPAADLFPPIQRPLTAAVMRAAYR